MLSFLHLVQAEITAGPTDVLENETNTVTFSCQAVGEPVPNISWYFDGTMINVSDTSTYNDSNSINGTEVTSLLTILNTQSSNAGIYTCEAENFLGTDGSSGILTINGEYLHIIIIIIDC